MDYEEAQTQPTDLEAGGEGDTNTTTPSSLRGLRACMFCSLVKTTDQFFESGCENCPFLDLADNRERILQATSGSFAGYFVLAEMIRVVLTMLLQVCINFRS